MNQRQIGKAARLYILAVVACGDSGGSETEEESDVMERAIKIARNRLEQQGHHHSELGSLQACIEKAKNS